MISMKICAGLICLMTACCGISYAAPGGTRIASGTYFDAFGDARADAYALLAKIDSSYLLYASGGAGATDAVSDILAKTLDGLYQEVSDILDIHMYSFKGSVVAFADQPALERFLKQQYGIDFPERSLYHFEKNTIYISLADATVGMLGHEIAHAVISNYFVVPPPEKVQEVLCGYVEYSLRKTRSSLP